VTLTLVSVSRDPRPHVATRQGFLAENKTVSRPKNTPYIIFLNIYTCLVCPFYGAGGGGIRVVLKSLLIF